MKNQRTEVDITSTKLRLMVDNKVPRGFVTNLGQAYQWIWLPSAEVKQLLDIRNADHVLSNMRNTSSISLEEHLDFLQKYASLQRIDFVLFDKESGEYVGGMNISLTNYGFEIGKYIGNADYLGRSIALPMSISFISFVKKNIGEVSKIHAVTRIDNYKNINLNFKLGFRIVKLIEKNYWLMEMN